MRPTDESLSIFPRRMDEGVVSDDLCKQRHTEIGANLPTC